jgi:hypothetical protein
LETLSISSAVKSNGDCPAMRSAIEPESLEEMNLVK